MIKIKKQGMTLIEIVVSLALLAVLGMAFVSLFFVSTDIINKANENKLAELELRKFAAGNEESERPVHEDCKFGAGIFVDFSGLGEDHFILEIVGTWCEVTDEETGVSYGYFSQ